MVTGMVEARRLTLVQRHGLTNPGCDLFDINVGEASDLSVPHLLAGPLDTAVGIGKAGAVEESQGSATQ